MIYKYILQARRKDSDAMLCLIQKFYPLLRNYSIRKRKDITLSHRTVITNLSFGYYKHSEPYRYDHYNGLVLSTLKELLSNTEYEIIVAIYFHQYSVSQVALHKAISRQAVNQTRIRALMKLKVLL